MSTEDTSVERACYTRLEICEMFGISTKTFERLKAKGEIPEPDIKIASIRKWSSGIVKNLFRVKKEVKK